VEDDDDDDGEEGNGESGAGKLPSLYASSHQRFFRELVTSFNVERLRRTSSPSALETSTCSFK